MSDPVAKRPKMDDESVNEVQRRGTSLKKTCNLYTQKFYEIVGLEAFVDKTLFIKAFFEAGDKVIVALAPRRFGKSTNMDMIKEFVTGNKKLFEDNQLKIWKEERGFFNNYCQKNPVIHVDFKHVYAATEDELLQSFREVIYHAFNDHLDLKKEVQEKCSKSCEDMAIIRMFDMYWKGYENLSRLDVIYGLRKLSWCLNVFCKKRVYAFIDEYDAPVMEAILTTTPEDGVLRKTIDLICEVMSDFLKGNKYVERGLINACVSIAAMPNNIQYYEFLREPEFSPYFGFTDKEVNSLFERDEFVSLKNDEVRKLYDGYRLLHTDEYVIYSSYSILEYLQKSRQFNKPQFNSYWADSGSIAYLKKLFAEIEIRKRIENLIVGEAVEIMSIPKFSIEHIFNLQRLIHQKLESVSVPQAHLFLQFLAENGYLNVVSAGNRTSTLLAPNNEIKKLLKEKCYDADLFRLKYQLSSEKIRNYVDALDSLLQQRDKNAFIRFARAVSGLFDGALMPKGKNEFHSILFTLAYNAKKLGVCSELSVQRTKIIGRWDHLDLLVILSEMGMILEVIFEDKSSEEVHAQILTQGYAAAFDDYKNITVKILLGMHMTKERKVSLTYTVDNSAKQIVTSNDTTEGLQVFLEQYNCEKNVM